MLSVYKPIGATPLQVVEKLKEKLPEYQSKKIGYAGRLDPMAHGVLILLIGEENKKKDQYLSLGKTYECNVLFGFSTDSYDLLGKIVKGPEKVNVNKEALRDILRDSVGKKLQEYPPFSSKTFKGKPLYRWSREDRLDEVIMPTRTIEIFSVKLLSFSSVTNDMLYSQVKERIGKVTGDFRQKEILENWKKQLRKKAEYPVAAISVDCSSGTYIRSLANNIGNEMNTPSLAQDIFRTRVGNFSVSDSLQLF